MPTMSNKIDEFFTKLYTKPSIKEVIADNMLESRKEVMQYKHHIETYLFLQHMAEYKIAAMLQWEQICKESRNKELNNMRNSND